MSEQEYGLLSRTLHALALSNRTAELSFDIELAIHGHKTPRVNDARHVFVSGLARAGTTILMRQIFETGLFRSLTYRDAPFVLAPNTWRSITARSQRKAVARERPHGDGLEHSYDSPEALEEIFWRVFCGQDYIRADRLVQMRADPDVIENFRIYVAMILKGAASGRYLSKNNNNIVRLPSLAAAFPHAVVLIPFREPLAHARSLLRQHRRFQRLHEEDPFSRRYMGWFVHHEFGSDHRPFVFPPASEPPADDSEGMDYWLQLWTNVYTYLLEARPSQAVLTSYERLCADRESAWPSLCEHIGIDSAERATLLRSPLAEDEIEPCSEDVRHRAGELHEELLAAALG